MARAKIERRVVYRTAGMHWRRNRGTERTFNAAHFVKAVPLRVETRARSVIVLKNKDGHLRSLWALDSAASIREAVARAKNGGKA